LAGIPIAREGYPFIAASLALTLAAYLVGYPWLWGPLLGVAAFVVAFFRDPERDVPGGDDSIVSPADGRVIKVERLDDPRFLRGDALKISIFMNVFNVHVNRAPAAGGVVGIVYNPGAFFAANLDKASMENEQNAVVLETPSGARIAFNQIAGLIARRIVCRVKAGDALAKGQRFGLIRFGSRVDVFLPPGCREAVGVGDRVRAGSSIIGYWR
jgi:phosphatidylserine decarboxylase